MKFVVLMLLVTHKIDYTILYDYSFPTYSECVDFTRFMNQRQKKSSNYVFMCIERKK